MMMSSFAVRSGRDDDGIRMRSVRRGREWLCRASVTGVRSESTENHDEGEKKLGNEQLDSLVSALLPRGKKERRRLLVFSRQWKRIRAQVYERITERAQTSGNAAVGEDSVALLRLVRELRELDKEMVEHEALYEKLVAAHAVTSSASSSSAGKDGGSASAASLEAQSTLLSSGSALESLVLLRRGEMREEFFMYCGDRIAAAHVDAKKQQSSDGDGDGDDAAMSAADVENIVEAVTRAVSLCKAHDAAAAEADAAKAKVDDVLAAPTLQEAEARIDLLAARRELDPATLMTFAKAYAGAKETDMTSEECKDTLWHLYIRARDHMQTQQPAPLRVLQYLLMLEDPVEVQQGLDDAFSSGPVYETSEDLDYVCITPRQLLDTIDQVMYAFDQNNAQLLPTDLVTGSMSRLLNVGLIDKMKELKQMVELKYM